MVHGARLGVGAAAVEQLDQLARAVLLRVRVRVRVRVSVSIRARVRARVRVRVRARVRATFDEAAQDRRVDVASAQGHEHLGGSGDY